MPLVHTNLRIEESEINRYYLIKRYQITQTTRKACDRARAKGFQNQASFGFMIPKKGERYKYGSATSAGRSGCHVTIVKFKPPAGYNRKSRKACMNPHQHR